MGRGTEALLGRTIPFMASTHDEPTWISHRGLTESAPENTLKAFRAARQAGFQALETDLRVTADDHLVLCHDADLTRLFGVSGRIDQMERRQVEALRFADGSAPLFLEQFLEEFAACQWTLDIKPESGEKTIRVFSEWAERKKATDWITAHGKFLMWSAAQEALLKEHFPAAHFYARKYECWRAGLCVLGKMPVLGNIRSGRTYALKGRIGSVECFRRDFVEAFHSRRARVVAYLPETDREARAAAAAGVDEILTDHSIVSLF